MPFPFSIDGDWTPDVSFRLQDLASGLQNTILNAVHDRLTPADEFFQQAGQTLSDITPAPVKAFGHWIASLPDLAVSGVIDIAMPRLAGNVVDDYRFINELPEADRQRVWDAALDRLEADGVHVPRDRVGNYRDFIAYLRSHGIDSPQRILSLKTAITLMDTRDRLLDPTQAHNIGRDRPIAVIIGAKSDHNGALNATNYPTADRFVQCGQFDVLYFETGSQAEADRILNDIHERTGRQIHTILFDGHGGRQSLDLLDSGTDADDASIDVHDLEQDGAFANLNDILDPNGQIILGACLNGEPLHPHRTFIDEAGDVVLRLLNQPVEPVPSDDSAPESDRYNLAQAFSHLAPNRPVYSSEVETYFNSIHFDPETLRPRISWGGHSEFVAQAGLAEYYNLRLRTVERSTERAAEQMLSAAMIASLEQELLVRIPSQAPRAQPSQGQGQSAAL